MNNKFIFFKKSLDLLLLGETKKKLIIFLIYLLIAAVLEFLSFGSIPILINALINPNIIKDKVSLYFNFSDYQILNDNFLIFFFIISVLIFLIKNIFLTYFSYFEGNLLKKIIIQMQTVLINNYAFLDYSEFKNNNSANIINKIVIQTERARGFLTRLIIILKELIVLISLIIILFMIHPLITFSLVFVFSILSLSFYFYFKKKNTFFGSNLSKFDNQKLKILNHLFYAFRDVKMFQKEDFFINEYLNKLNNSENSKKFIYVLSKIPKYFLETVALISLIIIFIIFLPLVDNNNFLIPILGTISIFVIRLIPVYNSITSSLHVVKFNWPIYLEIIKDVEKTQLLQEKNSTQINEKNFIFKNNIEFKSVNFSYSNTNKKIFDNANFNFYKGKVNGIIGESGVGKSTLVDLLTCLLTPQKGEILADGVNINEIATQWRKIIGYVPQSINLIDGSIAENIGFAVDSIDKNKINRILKKLNLEKFINSLKDGIDTNIGERGAKLSGGQKQRIGIARALYNEPQILILDESTNALDNEAEKMILQDIIALKSEITIIIISHKKTTINYCENIFKVFDGSVEKIKK